jgi:TRAP-type C4-dicarboxylate transport system permease small subunit
MIAEEGKALEEQRPSTPPRSWFERIVWAGGVLSAVIVLYILGLTTVAVVFRYFLGKPIRGVDEQTGFLVVAAVMAGAAEALRRDDHISIDILTNVVPPVVKRMLAGFGYAAIVLFSVILFYTAWETVTFSYSFQAYSNGALELPMWIAQSPMLAGAALLGLVAVMRFYGVAIGDKRR